MSHNHQLSHHHRPDYNHGSADDHGRPNNYVYYYEYDNYNVNHRIPMYSGKLCLHLQRSDMEHHHELQRAVHMQQLLVRRSSSGSHNTLSMHPHTLSIVVATIGRSSLERTLAIIASQELAPGDEVVLVSDDGHDEAKRMFRETGLPGICVRTTHRYHDGGDTPRNLGMGMTTGDHLMFMDDDDVYAPGAVATVRCAVTEFPDAAHVFRMRSRDQVYWRERNWDYGNVGTPMIVLPRSGPRGRWGGVRGESLGAGGDCAFFGSTLPLYRDVRWHEEVIALIRPS